MRLYDIVGQYQKNREIKRFRRENTWEGLVPGDVVEYRGQRYRYVGVNRVHDRLLSKPSSDPIFPIFGTVEPTVQDNIWFLRTDQHLESDYVSPFELSDIMRELITKDSAQSAQVGGIRIKILNLFDNPSKYWLFNRDDLVKVGHITPDEWRVMVEKLKKELAGAK